MDESRTVQQRRRCNLERLLSPKSIAVVGASADPSKAGYQALCCLADFPGRIVGVNPREKQIQGRACFPSLDSLPEPVDMAVLAIPAEYCVKAAEQAAGRGVGGIFIISGGFAEAGETGKKLQADLAAICRETSLRLLGPNTSGYINPYASCVASFVPGVNKLQKGRVAVVAQSGGINLTLAFLLASLGEGVSLSVGLGNGVDVGMADVLEMVADDPNTSAIAIALEGVPSGRALFEVVRRVTPRKPVVAVVAGRAYVGDLAVSHTGNLMGSHQRTVAALTQAGALVFDSTELVAQAAATLAGRRLAPKRQVNFGLVTGQAGPGLLIMDGLRQAGVEVPELSPDTISSIQNLLPPLTYVRNPVDTGRPGASYPQIVELVAKDDRVDAVLAFALGERLVLDRRST